jgi:hypothetical protein
LTKTAIALPLHYFTICIMCDRTGHQFTIQEDIAHFSLETPNAKHHLGAPSKDTSSPPLPLTCSGKSRSSHLSWYEA